MKQISNKRSIADIVYDSTNIQLSGTVEVDSTTNKVKAVTGDIHTLDDKAYVGNFSLLGININDPLYIAYRTEISQAIDSLVSEVNNGTIEGL